MGPLETWSLIGAQDRAIALATQDKRRAKAVFRALWLALYLRGYERTASVLTNDAKDVFELNQLCSKPNRRKGGAK